MKTHGKVVVGCVLAACLGSTAMARPATSKDFVGKKICWTTPTAPPTASSTVSTYYPGGKFNNTYWGNGICQAHHCVADNGTYDVQTEKLSDGTFKSTTNVGGAIYESTGRYCP